MKLRIYVEADVSATIAKTIQRSGLTLEPDGTGMKIRIANTPTIPKRKVKVQFVENPSDKFTDITDQ